MITVCATPIESNLVLCRVDSLRVAHARQSGQIRQDCMDNICSHAQIQITRGLCKLATSSYGRGCTPFYRYTEKHR